MSDKQFLSNQLQGLAICYLCLGVACLVSWGVDRVSQYQYIPQQQQATHQPQTAQ